MLRKRYIMHLTICFRSGYICIQGMNASTITRRKQTTEPVLEKYVFIPNEATLSYNESVRVNIQIVLENIPTANNINILELIDIKVDVLPLAEVMCEILAEIPLIRPNVKVFSPFSLNLGNTVVQNKNFRDVNNICIAIGQNLLFREEVSTYHKVKCIFLKRKSMQHSGAMSCESNCINQTAL